MKENDLIQGRYRLQEPLGRGGMAEVWCARDERLDRPVAVKFLAPQFYGDAEFLVRFFNEAQLVARLSHPNVTDVLDFGEYEERPYLVMEYVGGGALSDLTGEPMLPERAAEIVSQAAWGAGAAHAAGMVHRDIKPANILLTEYGHAKLADFGIALARDAEQLTATGQAIGSPHYVSPEQASGRGCTSRSDVYSLGVVLYELLTGKPPFDADNVTAIAIAHVESPPVPPSRHLPDLDPDLEAIVMRCLQKDPDERFEDGRALGAALEEPASAAAFLPPTAGELEDYDEAPRGRRVLATLLIVGSILGLLTAAVLAASREPELPREISHDLETENQGTVTKRRKASPSPSATQDGTATTVATSPSPSPSPTEPEEDEEQEPVQRPRSGGGGGGGGYVEPSPEPTAEPSPQPTAEPTTEPSPQPSPTSE